MEVGKIEQLTSNTVNISNKFQQRHVNESKIRRLFHHLWTNATENRDTYDKKEWQQMAQYLKELGVETQC